MTRDEYLRGRYNDIAITRQVGLYQINRDLFYPGIFGSHSGAVYQALTCCLSDSEMIDILAIAFSSFRPY